MTEQVLDPETMSMEDLRKAADEQARAQSTQVAEVVTQDAKQEEVREETEQQEVKVAAGPFFAERSIDLGDGAGIQVFKGKGATREDALESLSDKLAEAQTHATKKIRELSKAKPVVETVSKDDEALYSAELLSSPTIAFKKLFEKMTGIPIEEFKTVTAREKAFQAAQEKKQAADAFVVANPDYHDTPRNGQLINKWCALHNDFSTEGLTKAYTDLAESGLLQVKDAEAGGEQKKAEAEARRIADAAEAASSQRTRRASGLSTQRRTPTPVAGALSEEDMYALPLEELRKRANQQIAG